MSTVPKKKTPALRMNEYPALRTLHVELQRQVAQMQTAKSKQGARALFASTREELGRAAVAAAKRART